MVQCKAFLFLSLSTKINNFSFLNSKVFYGISCQYNKGEIFKLYEIDVAKMQWKEINSPDLIEGQVTSIKGQLYIFSICNSDNPPCTNENSVFFFVQSEWQEFKKEGNVTDIVTIFPYQA